MHTSSLPETYRRSSRVPFSLPMLVTSLQPGLHFSEVCETMVVNAHGCAVRSPMKLDAGVAVHLHSKEGREATAHVVDCEPIGVDQRAWRVGARLDHPDNFWGLHPCPADWDCLSQSIAANEMPLPRRMQDGKAAYKSETALKVIAAKAHEPVQEDRVRELIAEVMQKMEEEIGEIRDKVAAGPPKRSNFEVSLSSIPPELEEKLWARLRQDLGTQVLQYAGEQAESVLVEAKTAIDQKLAATQGEFLEQVKEELETVGVRAQRLSDEIDDGVRQQLRAGLEKVQQNIFEAGTRLERRSDEFYQTLQQRIGEEHQSRLREIGQVQAAASAETAHQQERIAELGERVARLDDIARRMESDLDMRLSRMSGEILAGTRAQLENDATAVLKELESRNAAELGSQLDAACGRLKLVQKGVEIAAAELLRANVAETLQTFQESMRELAGETVGRWRQALARDLTSVARTLGNEVRLEVISGSKNQTPSS